VRLALLLKPCLGHGAILRQLGQRFGGLCEGQRGLDQRGAQRLHAFGVLPKQSAQLVPQFGLAL